MKLSSLFAGVWWLAASLCGHAQISRAFPDGVLLPSGQSRPVQVAAAGTSAVILPFPAGQVLVHENSGGTWSQVQSIPVATSTAAMNSSGTAFAIGRADRIDLRVAASHGDLRAITRLAGKRFDLHRAVGDLRHFEFEQPADEFRARAAENDLRSARRVPLGG